MDVRDLAHAFVLGLKKEESGGERFIIRGGGATWQDFSECFFSPRRLWHSINDVLTSMIRSHCSREEQ